MVTRKYQGKDGSDRYSTEIVLDNMQMLDGKQDGAPARPAQSGRMDPQNRASMAAQE
jgi:single-strand DNA-binding protein